MTYIVTGLFDDPMEARKVIEELENNDLDRGNISMVANKTGASAGQGVYADDIGNLINDPHQVTFSGIGSTVCAGLICSDLHDGSENFADILTRSGVPEDDAQYYAEGIRRGSVFEAVSHCDDTEAQTAADIMRRHGAVDLEQRGAYYRQAGYTGYNAQAQPLTADMIARDRDQLREHGQVTIPVVEEQLQVGKREVERGGARIYTHVTEKPVQDEVRLREEHVTIDRRPADRPATEQDMATFREGAYEVPETREETVVAKKPRVVEEVVIGKEAGERVETIHDTVRRTDVDVEPMTGHDVNREMDEDEEARRQDEARS